MEGKSTAEMAAEITAKIDALKTELSAAVKKEDLKAVQDQLNDFLAKNKDIDMSQLKEQLTDVSEQIAQMREKFMGNQSTPATIEQAVKEFIAEKHEEIKSLYKKKHGEVEFEVSKAVGSMTTGSSTPQGTVPVYAHQQFAPASNVNLREQSIMNMITTVDTQLAAYPYTETLAKEGGYTFVAEGGAKPQIDLKFETRYAQPVKAAAYMRLTEESLTDIVGLQSIATDYLLKAHNRNKAKGILNGDGVSPNPKGATTYGRAFVAGDMANAVDSPNILDVINAAVTDIYTTHNFADEANYVANICLMNPIDFYLQIVSAKDGDGKPLFPMASLFNMTQIGSVMVFPDEDIAAGKLFVADLSKYNVTNYVPYSVRIGWVNDDFIKNQFVMVGESRFHAFVKKLDEQAFIYDDIATIKTAIAAA